MTIQMIGKGWAQGVCDSCGYCEGSYGEDQFAAVLPSELGHHLGNAHWLWTYTEPADLCPRCSKRCGDCSGLGCDRCDYHGRIPANVLDTEANQVQHVAATN